MIGIRRTLESDIPALARIVSRNDPQESAEHFIREIGLTFVAVPFRPWFYTAELNGEIAGCGGYAPSWLSYAAFNLCWINVDPDAQRKGVGRAIVGQCLRDLANRANIVILATAVPEFYSKSWGFRKIETFCGSDATTTYTLMSLPIRSHSEQQPKGQKP